MTTYDPKGLLLALSMASVAWLSGCSDGPGGGAAEPSAFALKFTATAGGKEVGCTDELTGVGAGGEHTVGLSDLRFYISNLRFTSESGEAVALTLDEDEFQYSSDAGSVALIDLTGNSEGTCAGNAVAFAEGTARTNDAVRGMAVVEDVASVSFDVGVPQALMKETIANETAEGAPSPLNEMYWSWATGYRHFVMNFTVEDGAGEKGDGYLHIGSRDCGPADGLALEDRESCGFVNTPTVALSGFDLSSDVVGVELPLAVAGLDFVAPIYDMTTFEAIGEGPGVECHSSPMQPDCEQIFASFGVSMSSGESDASKNTVFSRREP